jgi:hypothetical protein
VISLSEERLCQQGTSKGDGELEKRTRGDLQSRIRNEAAKSFTGQNKLQGKPACVFSGAQGPGWVVEREF